MAFFVDAAQEVATCGGEVGSAWLFDGCTNYNHRKIVSSFSVQPARRLQLEDCTPTLTRFSL